MPAFRVAKLGRTVEPPSVRYVIGPFEIRGPGPAEDICDIEPELPEKCGEEDELPELRGLAMTTEVAKQIAPARPKRDIFFAFISVWVSTRLDTRMRCELRNFRLVADLHTDIARADGAG
jgi:hypothetical protein